VVLCLCIRACVFVCVRVRVRVYVCMCMCSFQCVDGYRWVSLVSMWVSQFVRLVGASVGCTLRKIEYCPFLNTDIETQTNTLNHEDDVVGTCQRTQDFATQSSTSDFQIPKLLFARDL